MTSLDLLKCDLPKNVESFADFLSLKFYPKSKGTNLKKLITSLASFRRFPVATDVFLLLFISFERFESFEVVLELESIRSVLYFKPRSQLTKFLKDDKNFETAETNAVLIGPVTTW